METVARGREQNQTCNNLINEGSIEDAVNWASQLKVFKFHFFVKRVQAWCNSAAVMQIDFAENFAAVAQDEDQNAQESPTYYNFYMLCLDQRCL